MKSQDTIVAIATPPGRGGVGIVRVSGLLVERIAHQMMGHLLQPRYATFATFKDQQNQIIDQGIVLYFKAPHSFTGEDILEFQGHGSPVVLDQVLKTMIEMGARLAKPGEFSERAFLNNKIDLTQAEAIADLINASSSEAARGALRSLQGEFSQHIHRLLKQLITLRKMVEAAIDFPEEEIDFLAESSVQQDLIELIAQVKTVEKSAHQGALLQEGMTVVILGEPNVGKSSLLNALAGKDSAIVTDIAGTTRDLLRENIHIDGMPLHIIDTAGLRETQDVVEKEGIRRAENVAAQADIVLFVVDATQPSLPNNIPINAPVLIVKNKMDLTKESAQKTRQDAYDTISISAKTGEGLDLLKDTLKNRMGFQRTTEGTFVARRRHLNALAKTQEYLEHGLSQLKQHRASELLAEDLRLAQQSLSEITGEFHSDDLLGEIFSSFCIGK